MAETREPQSREPQIREDLLQAFRSVHAEADELFASFAGEDFFRRPADGVWSPGEDVIHLIKSVKAVATGMALPRFGLRLLFGTVRGSRTYGEVRESYLEALANGAVAAGRFVPQVPAPESSGEASRSMSRALSGWRSASRGLVAALEKWSEEDLDRYRLPHPVLGKITVREMLFFTHYHDLHHLELVRKKSAAEAAKDLTLGQRPVRPV